jgi:hypothetical protein
MGMKKQQLGSQAQIVSRVGLSCLGMSGFYGERNDEESASGDRYTAREYAHH